MSSEVELSGQVPEPGYEALLGEVAELLESARRSAARAVNAVLTQTYFEIGRRIVESEHRQAGQARYGELLVENLAKDLTRQFGRGFSRRNVFQMRAFYLAYSPKVQTVSAQSFPLPWSHYVRLLSVDKLAARDFYDTEALREGWSVRQLDGQIATLFYERLAHSKDKAALLQKGATAQGRRANEFVPQLRPRALDQRGRESAHWPDIRMRPLPATRWAA